MTKDLGAIAELKTAIDSLTVISHSIAVLSKHGIHVSQVGIPFAVELGKKRLANLEKVK